MFSPLSPCLFLSLGTRKVYSAFRLIKRAADAGKKIAVINLGPTRAEHSGLDLLKASKSDGVHSLAVQKRRSARITGLCSDGVQFVGDVYLGVRRVEVTTTFPTTRLGVKRDFSPFAGINLSTYVHDLFFSLLFSPYTQVEAGVSSVLPSLL